MLGKLTYRNIKPHLLSPRELNYVMQRSVPSSLCLAKKKILEMGANRTGGAGHRRTLLNSHLSS